jgi:hypothetical protein
MTPQIEGPDLKLYQEILFLQHLLCKTGKWVVENVILITNH